MKFSKRHFVSAVLAIIALPQILCAVDEYIWGSFNPATISLTNISKQSDIREGSAVITLTISGDDPEAIITADNTAAAQLSNGTDTLITEYKLTFDGDGSSSSGGVSMDEYVSYDSFLSPGGLAIKYAAGDNTVQVTLHVQASNRPNNVADKGNYKATQVLTVTWDGL
jgi:hypothetical protein